MAGVSLPKQRLSHVLNVMPIGVIYTFTATFFVKLAPNPFIEYTSWVLIAVTNFLYFNCVISLAFVCNFLVTDSTYIVFI